MTARGRRPVARGQGCGGVTRLPGEADARVAVLLPSAAVVSCNVPTSGTLVCCVEQRPCRGRSPGAGFGTDVLADSPALKYGTPGSYRATPPAGGAHLHRDRRPRDANLTLDHRRDLPQGRGTSAGTSRLLRWWKAMHAYLDGRGRRCSCRHWLSVCGASTVCGRRGRLLGIFNGGLGDRQHPGSWRNERDPRGNWRAHPLGRWCAGKVECFNNSC